MCEEHLDLLPELHRDLVLGCLRDGTRDISGVLMLFSGDLARICIRAALLLGWTCLAGVFQRLVFGDALACRTAAWVGVVPAKLLQGLALGADVLKWSQFFGQFCSASKVYRV